MSIIVEVFCALWSIITILFCVSSANGGTAFLLTDGSVLMQECIYGYGTRRWWKLVPDNIGSYFHGTWHPIHDSHVGRKYFASAILADGRLLVCGGEYSDASRVNSNDESNRCEIYDPVADVWSEISPLADANGTAWDKIGDAPCALLPDGRFLLGNSDNDKTAIFDPNTMAWTNTGLKNQISSEESWTLLPDGAVIAPNCFGHPTSERFDPANNSWSVDMSVPSGSDLVEDASKEIGPGVLLPNGQGFYVGAAGKTALYKSGATANVQGQWTPGPVLPKAGNQEQGTKDGPACLLVNDNVLIGIAPVNGKGGEGDYLSPTSFFEFDGANINVTNNPPNSDHPTYVGRMLLLPNGDVLFAREDDSSFFAYTGYGSPNDKLQPIIKTCPATIIPGSIIQVAGLEFNGFSQAVGYGDDSTAATNYPLVRIKNHQTGHLRYCRTFNHTTLDGAGNIIPSMGLATGGKVVTTNVQVPANLELGESDLFVVANGIESLPFKVNVRGRG